MRGEVEMRNQPHGSCLTLGTGKEDREPSKGWGQRGMPMWPEEGGVEP